MYPWAASRVPSHAICIAAPPVPCESAISGKRPAADKKGFAGGPMPSVRTVVPTGAGYQTVMRSLPEALPRSSVGAATVRTVLPTGKSARAGDAATNVRPIMKPAAVPLRCTLNDGYADIGSEIRRLRRARIVQVDFNARCLAQLEPPAEDHGVEESVEHVLDEMVGPHVPIHGVRAAGGAGDAQFTDGRRRAGNASIEVQLRFFAHL